MLNNLTFKKQGLAVIAATALCFSLQSSFANDQISPLNARISYGVARTYRIGSGDLLTLNIYPQTEYSAEKALVRSDGNVSFPIIGQLNVSGRTIEEVQQDIQQRLDKTIRNYNISVTVANTRPALFYLSGAVNKLGPLEIVTDSHETNRVGQADLTPRTEQSLINILANAGGLKLNADLSNVQVKNGETGEVESYNLWKVLKEADATQNPWLNSGDSINVPELPQGQLMPDAEFNTLANSVIGPKSFPVRVFGQVKTPNLIHLEGETPLLSTAIAMAGGFTEQGLQKAVVVRRFTDENHFSTLLVDATKNDFSLRPNDIVYIGESKMYKAGRYMQEVAHILQPFQEAATTGGMAGQAFGFGGWRRFAPQGSSSSK